MKPSTEAKLTLIFIGYNLNSTMKLSRTCLNMNKHFLFL